MFSALLKFNVVADFKSFFLSLTFFENLTFGSGFFKNYFKRDFMKSFSLVLIMKNRIKNFFFGEGCV